jgi:hypothetical protein
VKYVDWVDRVLNAAARLAAEDPETARYGMQILKLPAVLGFGDVAFQPGFSDAPGGLYGALHDALGDLQALGLVEDLGAHTFKLPRHALDLTEASIKTSWHQIFDMPEPTDRELELLRYVATAGVVEAEDWGETQWLYASKAFPALGWEFTMMSAAHLTDGLAELRCVTSRPTMGEVMFAPTYIGIVRATEKPEFVRTTVPEGAPTCFISYAHEDQVLARDIAYGLQDAKLGVEIDEEMLAGGDSIIERVADATKDVEFVIALVSRHSVDSRWCRFELALAMTDELAMPGTKVIPVKVGKVEMPPMLRHKLYRSVEPGQVDVVVRRLVSDIGKHRERKAGTAE